MKKTLNDSSIEHARQFLRCIAAPAWALGAVVELRALNSSKATVSGYYDAEHQEDLVAAALHWSGRAGGVYLTLNPVITDCLARAANRFVPYAKHTTGDEEIIKRHWLLIDTDPKRPSGISANDGEHELALERSRRIQAWLSEQNWPLPLSADSGNGGHLLYRIDLPADDGDLVKRVLQLLDKQFSDEVVNVDVTVHNPARISKFYGTLACKGDSVPNRPHRLAKILEVPDNIEFVPRELLEAIAGAAAPATAKPLQQSNDGATSPTPIDFDPVKYLQDHGVQVGKTKPYAKGGKLWELSKCPWRPNEPDGGAYVIQFADGTMAAGCHHNQCDDKGWNELRDAIEPGWRETNEKKPAGKAASVAQQIVALAADDEFFHTAENESYVTTKSGDYRQTWRVKSDSYRLLLRGRLYQKGMVPADSALNDALDTLESKALFDGPQRSVHVRTAQHNGKYYIDLCNEKWEVVEISKDNWQVIQNSPVAFVRNPGMLPLPNPTRDGSVEQLREFVNVTPADWPLVVAWMIGALRPIGPYPILWVNGEQGSCKTTTCRRLRSLVDPNTVPLRANPKDTQTLMIWAKNAHVIGIDNLSDVSTDLSNGMCRLATGGGYSQKTNYTNDAETLFYYVRPQIVNGIGEIATRSDFLDRALSICLPVVPKSKRKTEKELDEGFAEVYASIFGALLTAMSHGLKRLPDIEKMELDLPRLADFATWIIAVEEALQFKDGTFLTAMSRNQDDANELAINSSLVAEAIRRFTDEKKSWEGTATDLLKVLNRNTDEPVKLNKSWPKNGGGLSSRLREIAPNLRSVGIDVTFFDNERPKRVTLKSAGQPQPQVEPQLVNPALAPYNSEPQMTCFGNDDWQLAVAHATVDTLLRFWAAEPHVAPVPFSSLNLAICDGAQVVYG